MKKIMVVFGTRPEAIKMCPIVLELKKRSNLKVCVCVTGQHRKMLDDVMRIFNIKSDYDLDIMKEKQSLFSITTKVLDSIKTVLEKEKPDVVLVHGDTSTGFSAALACFYMRIPVGHVEAGLRTYNIDAPYPEEFNRQAIDIISRFNFAPTEYAAQNLIKEGKAQSTVFVTGNTVIDAMRYTIKEDYQNPLLDWASGSRLVVLTAHRRETLGEPMRNMFRAILRAVEEREDVKVIYPVHLNPAVRETAYEILGNCDRIKMIDPLNVYDFHNFMSRCYIILTDSGGIQEEATWLGKPVLVMREATERPEGVEAGALRLVGTSEAGVYDNFICLLDNKNEYNLMARSSELYGNGQASEKIADIIENAL